MTTGKTIALIRWTFVDKVMSLLFNMLFERERIKVKQLFAAILMCSFTQALDVSEPEIVKHVHENNETFLTFRLDYQKINSLFRWEANFFLSFFFFFDVLQKYIEKK